MKNQHDLTEGSIKRHITNIAVPSMVGSIFMTLYNVVDTIWAGRLGVDIGALYIQHQGNILIVLKEWFLSVGDSRALTALSITFPVFLILLALSMGVMSGCVALIGNALGSKNDADATTYLIQGFIYATMTSILVILLIPIFPYIMDIMEVQDEVVRLYARQYLNVLIYGAFFFSSAMVCNAGLVARGDTRTQRNISIVSFFLNLILDPLFMLGWGPIPAMGISGIALATITAQALSFGVSFWRLYTYHAFKGLCKSSWYPRWSAIGQIAKQSIPQSLNMAIVAFLLATVNGYSLRLGGAAAAAAYGICLRIEQIALIPSMGVSTAISSIGSQNNGARKIERIKETYRTALVVGIFLWIFIMTPLTRLFPVAVIEVFTFDPDVIAVGLSYLKVCFFTFYAYLLFNFSGSVMQAIKKPYWMTIYTLMRNCLLPFITFPLLSSRFGLNGVWYGILINNWIIALVAFITYRILIKKREREIIGA